MIKKQLKNFLNYVIISTIEKIGDDDLKTKLKKYITILLGLIITAYAISTLYLPNKVVSGGVSGISTILYHQLGIQPGLSFAVINILLLLIAFKFIGKEFVVNSVLGAGLISVLVEVFSYLPPLTNNVFLATVFGSVLYGFGIGLTLIEGASSGGTDILGRLLQCIFPHIKIGRMLLFVDLAVIVTSLIIFKQVDLTLYGIIALFLSTYSIDLLMNKLNVSKLAFIVTDKGKEIAKMLVSTSPRGVTILDAVGAYTMEEREVLMCALKESEIIDFQRKILEIDELAFIIYSESQQIVGNGFYVYR